MMNRCAFVLCLLLAVPCFADPFLRGDANADGSTDLSDMVGILGHLFLGAESDTCRDALDVNDDGEISIVDPIFGLNFLFQGGPAVPAPGIFDPGLDPTPDEWDCGDFIEKSCLSGNVENETDLPGVFIDFGDAPCEMTLEEAAAGVVFPYFIDVGEAISIIAVPQGTCQPAGPANLYPLKRITGNEQNYCRCDNGKCFFEEHPADLEPGTYTNEFEWDGVNWIGPSDFSNPKGEPFPPGSYRVEVRAEGRYVDDRGNEQPYAVSASYIFELLP